MSGTQVIKAASMFTPSGAAAKTSVVKEMILGAGLGTVLGFWWQTYHWNENKKWDDFYAARAAAKAKEASA
ncbi:COX5C [Auxenochlorella protothecoides x Auxenochlorella symbiontica]|uniref:Cytochrome c oxidase subunit 5C n=1 Tax=Auxenochlorella protothecoides TaxID=3075 RepID=A0A087SGB9_AUXPR|nr:hypothetical protein F751_3785 [Auxenochlorella protothecoides]KFM24773.1 hypothetical protein F751_3785 [Auxenochlorella protothecoides]RMZ53011.1 hypothetical protein APUTEX25_001130 [Auxenochlorella protothecoides]|eukprot:RMZ53011.1 hypothetical protein APUTEX25_001130 [Auxenochlorella protothecoides]